MTSNSGGLCRIHPSDSANRLAEPHGAVTRGRDASTNPLADPRAACVPQGWPEPRLSVRERRERLRIRADLVEPRFTSIALFFNLTDPAKHKNAGNYRATTVADVQNWLQLGMAPTLSDFVANYWATLSYGKFRPAVDANRDNAGTIQVPTITAANNDAGDWGKIAQQIIQLTPEAIWQLSGGLTDGGGTRLIPSVVVVQNYDTHSQALFEWDWTFSSGGNNYKVLDICHVWINDVAATLVHEYSHNFLEGPDLYGGGGGKVGYWDVLGDALSAGRMSETSSYWKEKRGWIAFKGILNGPLLAAAEYSLAPFTTSGEAFKVVPDPVHNPDEYFLLEFRTSTGNETWRPDGGLDENGLLITHVNHRLGEGGPSIVAASPFMDICEADGNDGKCWDDRGDRSVCDLPWSDTPGTRAGDPGASSYPPNNWPSGPGNRPPGTLFPARGNDQFTSTSTPSSVFYGGRDSGLQITNIRVDGGEARFTLELTGADQSVYVLGPHDRWWLADFNADSKDELLIFNGQTLALLDVEENQFHVVWRADDWLGGWHFGPNDRLMIGDFNGDGRADIFIRSDHWAGLLISNGAGFDNVWMTGDPAAHQDWIGGWHLGSGDRHYVGDFDGDGKADVFIRSPGWAGILRSDGAQLNSAVVQQSNVGTWWFSRLDRELVGRFDGGGTDDIFTVHPGGWTGVITLSQPDGGLGLTLTSATFRQLTAR